MNNSSFHNISSTNDTIVDYTPLQATLIGISAGLLSLVTIAGNLMVMISFKLDKQLQTISNYFLFSLAVADIIIGSISMPLFTVFLIQQHWTLGNALCDAWLSVDYLASNASVLNLLVISFDRYFSVTRPLTYRARRTTRKAALMIFSAWAISAIVWPPWIIAWPYIEGERKVPKNECYIQFIYSNEYMSIVTLMIAFFVPVAIMIGLYIRVWWETVKRQRELVHLQAGKRASSKRSDSSDETVDDLGTMSRGGGGGIGCSGGVFRGGKGGWRTNLARSAGSNRSKESQDITYMPTSMFRTRASANSLTADFRELDDPTGLRACLSNPLSFCCSLAVVPTIEDASSEGYNTPRSLETPVQSASKCPSLNHIRDPYATRLPPLLRHSASIEERLPRYPAPHMQRANSAQQSSKQASSTDQTSNEDDSIYTILIRFPPKQASEVQQKTAAKRVPSIQMLPEDGTYTSEEARHYPRSLPIVRRFDNAPTVDSPNTTSNTRRGAEQRQTTNHSIPSSPSMRHRQHKEDNNKLPLDARLVPRQLVRAQTATGNEVAIASATSGGNAGTSQAVSLLSVTSSGLKRPNVPAPKAKKASSEKKQDRKAAKTLSAILLAFIVTWTPYSVLVVINATLGKEEADKYIPSVLWDFSYYLCYINSTVNPMLYALCNAAFRRTYVRILTCRWGSRARQPVNRYYYG